MGRPRFDHNFSPRIFVPKRGVSPQASFIMQLRIIALFLYSLSCSIMAEGFEFEVTREFCELHFKDKMTFTGKPFNATDVVDKDLPNRRLISESVTSNVAYIWYEHGGRGYHQHLVSYNVLKPTEVSENFTFFKTEYKNITELIKNKDQLSAQSKEEL